MEAKEELFIFQLDETQKAKIEQEIFRIINEAVKNFTSEYEPSNKYLKKWELVKYLHLSNNTVDKLIKNGLPRLCIQGVTLYSKEQVDEWLKRHKVQG